MQDSILGRMPRVRRCGSGFAAEGPGFFVWDPDRRAVAEAARALSRGAVPLRTVSRLLFVHGGPTARSGDPESLDA
jgi:hypothetical protein